MPIPQRTASVQLLPRSPVQDSVPQDAPNPPVGAAAAPTEPSRWSGKRTAAIAAIVLALTTAGAIAGAAASPHGIQTPSDQRGGRGVGPGAGQGRQLAPGGGVPGQQQAPGQQQPGQGFGTHPRGQR
jgi:hypothetical protein